MSAVAILALVRLRVNGPLYGRIVAGKDLVADLLPPPLFVVEPYVVALSAMEEPDTAKRAALLDRLQAARRDFDARAELWSRQLTQPEGRRALSEVVEHGRAFFLLTDKLAEQPAAAGAPGVLREELRRALESNRAAVVALVTIANSEVARDEAQGRDEANLGLLALIGLISMQLGLQLLMSWRFGRGLAADVEAAVAAGARLTRAVEDGTLAVRSDSSGTVRELAPLVEAMNGIMSAFVGKLEVMIRCVERISHGDIPPKLEEPYRGQFESMRQDVNRCIDAVRALAEDAGTLADAARAGRLEVRADANRHGGEFRQIIEGFNGALNALLTPVHAAQAALEDLEKRNLTARVQGEWPGDYARLKRAVDGTAEALQSALLQVQSASQQVSEGCAQIAAGSQSLAQGAAEQASALEETASSLEEISSMTRENAENTRRADALAAKARGSAGSGSEAMGRMVGAMKEIRTAAEGTAAIIRDINEIAFQTNLLALNAAVEAARAGDAGRGFAVVAEEVRALALRSKEAARRTEALIQSSVTLALQGGKISDDVSAVLAEIVSSVEEVSNVVGAIARASEEQSSGLAQVNRAVAEMDRVVQQTAGSSEESSSAAHEMAGQAQALAQMVSEFELGKESAAFTARAGRSRPRVVG